MSDPVLDAFLKARDAVATARGPTRKAAAQRRHMLALASLVISHRGLVVQIARRYAKGVRHLDVEDLTQEGMIGFLVAAARFDPAYGAKLSTFASWWITASINRAIDNGSRTVRVPANLKNKPPQRTDREDLSHLVASEPSPEDRVLESERAALEAFIFRHAIPQEKQA